MTLPVLICDDSSFARKQMARALPENWDVNITYAKNGIEALDAIRQGLAEVMFLDLNMPEMDGYEVLKTVRQEDLNTLVIVVSGDVQQDAHTQVLQLGAMDFIKKPVNGEQIQVILKQYGLLHLSDSKRIDTTMEVDNMDVLQELGNVSLGRGIELLSRLLDVYIAMPIPTVRYINIQDLSDTLKTISHSEEMTPVCQGFVGSGIAGEALILFNNIDMDSVADLMGYEGEMNEATYLELMLDIATVLSGSCLNGLTEQLDIAFSLGHPTALGRHVRLDEMVDGHNKRWNKTLAIEMGFEIGDTGLYCNLLLLFTEDSLDKINELAGYLK